MTYFIKTFGMESERQVLGKIQSL